MSYQKKNIQILQKKNLFLNTQKKIVIDLVIGGIAWGTINKNMVYM